MQKITTVGLILIAGLHLSTVLAGENAPFSTIIEAIGVKSDQDQTNNSWDNVSKIKGVKWDWPYFESGAHDSTMRGKAKIGKSKNPNVGETSILVKGARTLIFQIHIEVNNEPNYQTINDLFGKAKIKKISSSCDEDMATFGDSIYKFTKDGYKPLYVHLGYSWGAGGDSGSVNAIVANQLEDALQDIRGGNTPCTTVR